MVKENLIIENKKPFEIVQEVSDKYEVPSFEEFMKSYEGDVNYDDLNSGDAGEVNGYGPCRVCRTKSLTWIDLYIACPVPSCPDREPGH